jgi:hypothetical protein
MAAGFREGFVEAAGFRIRCIWRRGKGRHAQGRERLQSALMRQKGRIEKERISGDRSH